MARRLPWLVAIWSVPAALATMQTYLLDSPDGCGGSVIRAFVREAIPWLLWIPATPLVLRAAAWPDPLRARRIVGHVVAALGFAVLFGIVGGILGNLAAVVPSRPMLDQVEDYVIDWLAIQPLIYAGVLAAGLAIESARRRRESELARAELETELAQARLAALRAQLQPHFLFNTLNAAVTLARSGATEETARVLVLLSELLRQLLRDDAPHEVPLVEEVRLVELYLDIQRVRFGDRLRVQLTIDDAVRAALVPQLVLQPLVENAFRHGLAQRSSAGRIEIAASRAGDELELAVRDDGPGPAADCVFGVGLRNTAERLRRLYGERGTLALTGDAHGAVATVRLPLRLETAASPAKVDAGMAAAPRVTDARAVEAT